MDKRNQLTRTCASCGIEKPLSAFLQITGTHGTHYGTICSTCRSTGAREKKSPALIDDGQTTATSGTRIGAKEKVHFGREQKRIATVEETFNKEIEKKKEHITEEKTQKTDLTDKERKEHRDFFLQPKKTQRFLTKTLPVSRQGSEQSATEKSTVSATTTAQEKNLEAKKQQDTHELEKKQTTADLENPLNTGQTGDYKFYREGTILQQAISIFGTAAQGLSKMIQPKATENKAPTSENSEKNPLSEFINKHWRQRR